MAFTNDIEFQDDYRKVGQDVIAGFETPGAPANPTEHASSENLNVAPKKDDANDLDEPDEDEDDLEDDDDDLDDDLDEDEDLEDDDDEDEEDDDLEDDDDGDEDDDEDDDEDEDPEDDDDDSVKGRAGDALKTARKQ